MDKFNKSFPLTKMIDAKELYYTPIRVQKKSNQKLNRALKRKSTCTLSNQIASSTTMTTA